MLNVSNEKIRKYCHIVMTIIVFIIQIMILLIKYHTSENLLTEIMDSISTIAITCVAVFLGVKRVVHKIIPPTIVCSTNDEILKFMTSFIKDATSTVTIASNSMNWLSEDSNDSTETKNLKKELLNIINNKKNVEIIANRIPSELNFDTNIQIYKRNIVPLSRFTIINSSRSNAAKMAIAKGALPNHQISVYTYDNNEHIINLALDIIQQAKKDHDNEKPLG